MDQHPKETSRDRKRDIRKEQLLEIATHLFATYGLEGTTTKSIAKAAGVSPGLLYHYFASKEDLLVDVVTSFNSDGTVQEIVKRNDHGSINEALYRILKDFSDYLGTKRDVLWLVIRAAARFPAVDAALREFKKAGKNGFATFFEQRKEKGEIIIEDGEHLASCICHLLVMGQLSRQLEDDDIRQLAQTLLFGIVPRCGECASIANVSL